MALSIKSPHVAVKTIISPTTAPIHQSIDKIYAKESEPPTTVKTSEPIKPSQLFFGLIVGTKGCLPSKTPTAYPNVSLHPTNTTKVITRSRPLFGRASRIKNPAKKGKYKSEKVVAVAL
ncbi:unannotated protein [freshwater metagenome]|uniref:Unannotated protein n=1 Tax=freshwater metagenome TaxID=449393 RepID=A0A6J6VND4_9ZZZZ